MVDLNFIRLAGGAFGQLVTLLGLVGVLAALPGVLTGALAQRWAARISVALLLLAGVAMSLGAVGYLLSMRSVMEAVANVNPMDKEVILAEGMAESKVVIVLALFAAALPLGGGLALLGAIPQGSAPQPGGARLAASFLAGASAVVVLAGIALSLLARIQATLARVSADPSFAKSLIAQGEQEANTMLRQYALPAAAAFALGVVWFFAASRGQSASLEK